MRQSETGGDPGIKIFLKPRLAPRAPPASTTPPNGPPAPMQRPRSGGTGGLAELRPPQAPSSRPPDAAAGEAPVISAGALARLRRASGLLGEPSDSGNGVNNGSGGGGGGSGIFSGATRNGYSTPPAGSAELPQQFRQPYDPHAQYGNGGTGPGAASYQLPGYGLPGALSAASARHRNHSGVAACAQPLERKSSRCMLLTSAGATAAADPALATRLAAEVAAARQATAGEAAFRAAQEQQAAAAQTSLRQQVWHQRRLPGGDSVPTAVSIGHGSVSLDSRLLGRKGIDQDRASCRHGRGNAL